jgi:hypothetical protein
MTLLSNSGLDGGFFAAGTSYTSPNDPSSSDITLMKLNSSGDVQWRKTYGSAESDTAYSAAETPDAGFIVTGTTGFLEDRIISGF